MPEERDSDSSSSGEENLHNIKLQIFTIYSDLEDSSDTEVEIISTSPAVTKVTPESSEDSSGDTDSEEEKLTADVEEVSLVVNYLQQVTPDIAREFQVSLIENNFLF